MSQPRVNGASSTAVAPPRTCPVTHQTTDQEDFEHDFTTPGKIGNLECPFAKMTQNGLHTPNSQQDPIAAEFHIDKASTVSPPAAPVGACPIRFLDKHSPEEIAQYFENHKHEIPRSHEICVKRYQKNEQSIRLLDAKYGSLVNMIQGLGNKHKQYLPEADKESTAKEDDAHNNAMEEWAENVSRSDVKPDEQIDGEEKRDSRFERPLREIRVGESPSRPWGIPVPVDQRIPVSANASDQDSKRHPTEPPSLPSARTAAEAPPRPVVEAREPVRIAHQPQAEAATSDCKDADRPAQIVFNGPVFFGYSPEDAAKFLQALNLGDVQRQASAP